MPVRLPHTVAGLIPFLAKLPPTTDVRVAQIEGIPELGLAECTLVLQWPFDFGEMPPILAQALKEQR